ncbi:MULTISPECIES: arginine N-succinyltransferase [Vibrio]|uniref:Arginine N-succinyltransferase n=2 Tax=Vibrio genomosp. F10 TaxID=723171 RepID=A0A1B9R2F6_9VIBR|nr:MULTISPECIES: arginine N-succinyltransferase [Vibrio]OCH78214.1 arginine N-succinyltransferase [Vibrio genomosp. F10]OEE37572.1 arginine N-succinyltransferase [Vibrio genomosp. F10 str. ZF-129]OEE86541.1 arginine N-succinyltransferase [Vibrio genomosp. F10 str. 9ZD137]OEE94699.1 arginine N-succinyltransferase [Vibrio genomosp. F10 str. 9ZC157]WGW00588.1 arginine N-succinyltransferase [Vibrio sp. YMD68]
MLVIRPISMSDYDALHTCAVESGHGFTSLPVNEELLTNRIQHSEYSFAKGDVTEPGDEGYLMVGFDSESGEVAGCTGVEASIGWDVPFYSYHISTVVHASPKLGVNNVVKLLTFGNNYTGCTEICTLFLRPSFRGGLNGRLMSKCRFLMLAEHPHRFSKTIFAEMRGVSDDEGNSPFWQWLQEHFFSIDFTMADYLTGIGKKGFIADLMPKLPIYINLLSKEAQAVIGKVHDNTLPALKLLEREGFTCRNYVDIFDAGPTVECDARNIESVRHSFRAKVVISEHTSADHYLISNTSFENFRATAAKAAYDHASNTVILASDVAKALQVSQDDYVRMLAQ